MIELTTDELKEAQMRILDYVDAFCRNNGINYSLDGGTLLGAVRHKGYIPWDDDIDIMMTRDEYIQFIEKWNTTGNHPFVLLNEESGNSMGYPFGKISDPNTITYVGSFERTGVFIDLFPIDKVIDEVDFKTRRNKILELYKKRILARQWINAKKGDFTILKQIKAFIRKPRKDIYEYACLINFIAQSASTKDAQWYYDMVSKVSAKSLTPKSVFSQYIDIPFEDRTYRAVADYDTYLSCLYGDYMTPPPPEKRVSHHDFKAYWKE